MSHDDVLFGFRLRLFTLAEELGNVSDRPAGRWGCTARPTTAGRRRSTATGSRRCGSGSAAGRGCRTRSAPTSSSRILAFSLGHPGFGPRRISAELAREKWGGIRISEHGVWRVLRRVGPQHPLQAPGADRPPRRPLRAKARRAAERAAHRRLRARREGAAGLLLRRPPVGHEGRRSGNTRRSTSPPPTPGRSCAPRSATPRRATPPSSATWSPASSRRPAGSCGEVTTDNGSEFRSKDFGAGGRGRGRDPAPDQGRAAELKRLRRARSS